jgi:hypothetical protein
MSTGGESVQTFGHRTARVPPSAGLEAMPTDAGGNTVCLSHVARSSRLQGSRRATRVNAPPHGADHA